MQYTVIHKFKDLRDNNYIYNINDQYPRNGIKLEDIEEERVKELSSTNNKTGRVLIVANPKETEESKTDTNPEETEELKTDINPEGADVKPETDTNPEEPEELKIDTNPEELEKNTKKSKNSGKNITEK